MRADRTTQDDRIFSGGGQASWVRVDVRDAGGTFRDLDSQRGYSFVEKATINLGSDQPIATASVELRREIFKLSLAPDVAASVLNTLGGGTQLLLPNVQIRLYAQLQPSGVPADATKWSLIFDGVIDDVDSGRDPIVLNCSDFSKRIDEHWIEDERAYGVWQPGQRYIGSATVGAVVVPGPNDPTAPNNVDAPTGPWFRAQGTGVASANNWTSGASTPNGTIRTPTVPNGYTYVSSGGTLNTGASEPGWKLGVGSTTLDNGITWTCQQPTPPVWPSAINGTVVDNGITWTNIGEAGIVGAPARANGTVYATGSFIAPGNGFVYKNKGASGTSAGSPPVFNTTPGSTTADNTVTWTNVGQVIATPLETQIQMVLDDNVGGLGWTLKVPVATGEVVRPYTQSCMSTLQACQNLANIIGWDLRFKWDSGSSSFQLTIANPNRATTTSLYTIGPGKYDPIESFKRDITNVRTVVRTFFWDQVSVDSSGNPVLSHVDQVDATGLALYGRLFASVSEPAGSAINSAAAATNMAAAIVSDLGMPPIDVGVETDFSWWFEPTDLITLGADGLHADTDQKLAIYSLSHTIGQGSDRSETKFGLRGKPCSGHWRWNEVMGVIGQNGGPAKVLPLAPPPVPAVTATIAGASVSWQIPSDKRYLHTEVHISTSTGFVPSANTLAIPSRAGRHDFAPGATGSTQTGVITPNTTYYVKLVHKQIGFASTPPSPQASVVTGWANLAHLNPNITQNLCAVISAGTTSVSTSTSAFAVPFDTVVYDQVGIFNVADGTFTFTSSGKMAIYAKIVLTGVSPGDSALISLQKFGLGSFSPISLGRTATTVTKWSGVVSSDILEPELMVYLDVLVGTQMRIALITGPAGGTAATWTIQGGGLKTGTDATFFSVSQQLA